MASRYSGRMEPSIAAPSSYEFADPALEAEYQAAYARFVQPSAGQSSGLWLLVTLGLFAVADVAQGRSLQQLVILVAVLLFHELGHYVAMLGLGYRDVRMFFIPLFGAAVAGRPTRGSQTREAIVLLLGPLPGIVFGLSTAIAAVMFHSLLLKTIALYLVGINLLNLLPVVPLDGGRLASVLLFSRAQWSEGLFAGITLAAGAVAGFALGAPIFGGISAFLLLLLPVRVRMARVAARLREQCTVSDPTAVDEPTARALFSGVHAAMPKASAKINADWMVAVLEMGARRAPSLGRSLAIAAVWAAAFVVGLFGLGLASYVK